MERLQKIIAARGLCSRRRAEELIREGRVLCNGRVSQLGDTADPDRDEIVVDGKVLPGKPQSLCLMLNKPRGYVTTMADEKGRKTAAQLVEDCGARVVPIGRLDMDSEGLLLFTNDGQLLNQLLHPRHEVEKCYRVWVRDFAPEKLDRLKEPVVLDGYAIRRPRVRVINRAGDKACLEIIIHEGRNRQIRRMCDLAGMQVTRLQRIREGNLCLGNLPLGKWRYLTQDEISALVDGHA